MHRLALAVAALAMPSVAWATCPAAETIIDELTCSSTVSGRVNGLESSHLGGVVLADAYTCGTPYAPVGQNEPEHVYSFTCQNNGAVVLQISGLDCDLDIYILDDSCDPSTGCVAGSTRSSTSTDAVGFTCTAGQTYYVVVEGYGYDPSTTGAGLCNGGSEGDYTLTFDVSAGTGCSEDCDNGTDDDYDGDVDCDDSDCADDPICDFDADNDGYDAVAYGGTDCNDANAAVNPGATEVCDGIDNDCDGSVDESSAADAYTWYRDADRDGYGNPSSSIDACTLPSGYTADYSDCDDTRATTYPGAPETCDGLDNDCDGTVDDGVGTRYYLDGDGDTWGTASTSTVACSAPSGYVSTSTDCDDANAAVNPAATEVCDGIDNDCDASIDESGGSTWYRDADTDGYGNPATTSVSCSAPSGYVGNDDDCDDARSAVNPAATEVCNGRDDDCDGGIDEDGGATYYADADSDGFGNPTVTAESCTVPSGYVGNDDDCDDTRGSVNPGAAEVCDGIDNDCDSSVDESGGTTWYADGDADGYGTSARLSVSCAQPAGYVASSTDCNDADAAINPGATELCDGVDNDCDRAVDEDGGSTWYADVDTDGFGDPAASVVDCSAPSGTVAVGTDCDDADARVYPGADEYCNGVDDDCDLAVDEDAVDASWWYTDVDGDGFGDPAEALLACAADGGEVTNDDDCWDDESGVYPGAPETADGVDEDCDGLVDESTEVYDDDGDGFAEVGGDCDDGAADARPGAEESCDGVDEDCDGLVDEGTECADDDGDGVSENDGDCNDGDAAINPGAAEVDANGVDDDCDGLVDLGAFDPDGDGYTEAGGDCDETDASTHPGAEETADGTDEDCDGQTDEGTPGYDDDGDGYTEADGDCDDGDRGTAPDAAEVEDGVDNDCDGVVDEGSSRSDDDGDGFAEEAGDCDDADPDVNPAADEEPNGADDDCDGDEDEGLADADGDGYAFDQGDCDDRNGFTHPGALDACDGVDNDCDGTIDNGCGEDTGTGEKPAEAPGCGCSAREGGAGSMFMFLVLAATVLRRRRSE